MEKEEKAENEKKHYEGHFKRLRKRFLKDCGRSMHDYEILELFLHESNLRKDVKPHAKKLLNSYKSFTKLITASVDSLFAYGLKERKVVLIKMIECAALKLSAEQLLEADGHVLANWDYLIDYCRSNYAHKRIEVCGLIFLNKRKEVIHADTIQKGTLDRVAIYIREVIKDSLVNGAAGFIICHNHPSNSEQPSYADIEVTLNLLKSTTNLNLELFDHLIITQNNYFSFRENNMLDEDVLFDLLLKKASEENYKKNFLPKNKK